MMLTTSYSLLVQRSKPLPLDYKKTKKGEVMKLTFEQDIQEILDTHSIRFEATSLRDFSRIERLNILVHSFRAVNLVDALVLMITASLIIESQFFLDWFNLLIASVAGYSSWRLYNYLAAGLKLRKLYQKAL